VTSAILGLIRARRAELGLFFLLLMSTASFHHPVEYDNTSSRYYLVSAIVDYGRLDIDMYADKTIDTAVVGAHTYSNKAIGAPLLALPVYWALRHWGPGRDEAPLSPRAEYLCRLLTTSLPFALAGIVLYRLLLAMGAPAPHAFATVLAYAFGTIAWVHATMFSGHQMAANFALMSFAAIWFRSRRKPGTGWAGLSGWIGAGLLAGFAALADYTAIYLAAVLAVYAWTRTGRTGVRAAFLAGGSVPALMLALYNTACFGHPWSFSYAHLGYGEFAAGAQQGFLGVSLPDIGALGALLASCSRGLFFIMPVLLLSLAGFARVMRPPRRKKGHPAAPASSLVRADLMTIAAIVAGYLLINSGFYGWHGGWTFGPRYLVPMLPFLVMPMAFAIDRVWYPILFLCSAGQVGFAALAMPHTPEEISNPIVECIVPLARDGYIALNPGMWFGLHGPLSLLPWLLAAIGLAWVSWPAFGKDRPSRTGGDWRGLYALATIGIVISLAVVRTPPAVDLHLYRSRLLGNAADVLKSEALLQAATREYALSRAAAGR
jgi:hypothetical protein